MVRRILLFYKYININNVEEVYARMKATCTGLDFKGRVMLATEVISATLAGSVEATTLFVKTMETHPLFKKIDFKDPVIRNAISTLFVVLNVCKNLLKRIVRSANSFLLMVKCRCADHYASPSEIFV